MLKNLQINKNAPSFNKQKAICNKPAKSKLRLKKHTLIVCFFFLHFNICVFCGFCFSFVNISVQMSFKLLIFLKFYLLNVFIKDII